MELNFLTPSQVERFIDPKLSALNDAEIMVLGDSINEIKDTKGYRALMHLIALQYQAASEQVLDPYPLLNPNQENREKRAVYIGRCWGLSEILDLPGAVEDRCRELIERRKKGAETPSTGGGR